ncbi:Asp-tRNA(Asn)/Glu-tRNA(Gln) amidotransferase subunit GatC [Mycoplasmopsis gallinacea]|uniref:Glutamyl-tRNA amidotransferase n=1 Tax=Mycoplasmopsis gallinacea TaxID=29556 RepID=A0A449A3E2_9BACT|nr:Asp-tRNA(Asn)/Glu-tRNA(Gln) amidotransferase subunit GatC [Mycoplasmopsis gallinacea]QIW62119.1 glutamyl-tRNA amidotransferase [Mycoplasmopsis gallinacea]VEU58766.1 glutamyl-tRNA(gln)amidotransferase subunit C [Mycoplasmopsis gallinacea]
MKHISKEKLYEIVNSLMLEPSKEVIEGILEKWETIQNDLEDIKAWDLENVKPMTHINEQLHIDFLREDEPASLPSINKEQILANATEKDDSFVITTKVVD